MEICPYKVSSPDNFKIACTKYCPLWFEHLEMCSHKAQALLLYDIHHIVVKFGISKGIIPSPEEKKEEKENEKEGS